MRGPGRFFFQNSVGAGPAPSGGALPKSRRSTKAVSRTARASKTTQPKACQFTVATTQTFQASPRCFRKRRLSSRIFLRRELFRTLGVLELASAALQPLRRNSKFLSIVFPAIGHGLLSFISAPNTRTAGTKRGTKNRLPARPNRNAGRLSLDIAPGTVSVGSPVSGDVSGVKSRPTSGVSERAFSLLRLCCACQGAMQARTTRGA